jgi:hypothetical protein
MPAPDPAAPHIPVLIDPLIRAVAPVQGCGWTARWAPAAMRAALLKAGRRG